jgi:hypothetical protein
MESFDMPVCQERQERETSGSGLNDTCDDCSCGFNLVNRASKIGKRESMTQTEAKTILCAELSKIYGLQEGLRMAGTVIPGIMNDFNQMLERSQCGETVREEYRLEDGRARVFVTGRRTDGNSICYERIQVTG